MAENNPNSSKIQVIRPAGSGQTHGHVLGPSAIGKPVAPARPTPPKSNSK